jgi:CXXC-20-CXXC protein
VKIVKTNFNGAVFLHSLRASYSPIQCCQCGTKCNLTFTSRGLISLLIVAPIMVLNVWSLSLSYTIVAMIMFGVLLTLALPFVVKYSTAVE